MDLTKGHAALRAARGLLDGAPGREIAVDLAPVLAAFQGLPFVGPFGRDIDEFKHAAFACPPAWHYLVLSLKQPAKISGAPFGRAI